MRIWMKRLKLVLLYICCASVFCSVGMELTPTTHVLLAATGELVYALGAAIVLHDVDAAAQRFFLGHCHTDSLELRAALDAHVEITAYDKQLNSIPHTSIEMRPFSV